VSRHAPAFVQQRQQSELANSETARPEEVTPGFKLEEKVFVRHLD
jgi:hypothetical protein